MPKRTSEFNSTAERLSRNPLGILALFIVLIYGLAALALGVASGALDSTDRKAFIAFLVLFPPTVLAAFYRLVTRHHTKLYAPHDFQDPEGFFRALTPGEHRARLEREIRELEAPDPTPAETNGHAVDMKPSPRTLQTRHAWVLAEEFAFRELEAEYQTRVNRQLAVRGRDTGVDGALVHDGKTVIIEVKFTVADRFSGAVRRAREHVVRLSGDTCASSYIVAIVVDGLQLVSPSAIARAKEFISSLQPPTELRLYDFGELTRKYGIADGSGERTQLGTSAEPQ